MNIVSSLLALAVACLVFKASSSAPPGEQLRDKDATGATLNDDLLRTLQHLLERKAARMLISQVLATEQGGKRANWMYPPLSKVESEDSEGEESDSGSPMKKAARKHFEVSKPGTGPILNHPLDNSDTGLDRDTIIETLIKKLISKTK